MKRVLIFAVLVLLSAGVAQAGGYEVTKKAGAYDVTMTFDKNPPVASDNNVEIAIKDAAGKVVKDAKVKVEYSMPAMPGMPPMNYKTDAVLKGDVYKATLGLSMSGSWDVTVRIAAGGKTSRTKFTIDAK